MAEHLIDVDSPPSSSGRSIDRSEEFVEVPWKLAQIEGFSDLIPDIIEMTHYFEGQGRSHQHLRNDLQDKKDAYLALLIQEMEIFEDAGIEPYKVRASELTGFNYMIWIVVHGLVVETFARIGPEGNEELFSKVYEGLENVICVLPWNRKRQELQCELDDNKDFILGKREEGITRFTRQLNLLSPFYDEWFMRHNITIPHSVVEIRKAIRNLKLEACKAPSASASCGDTFAKNFYTNIDVVISDMQEGVKTRRSAQFTAKESDFMKACNDLKASHVEECINALRLDRVGLPEEAETALKPFPWTPAEIDNFSKGIEAVKTMLNGIPQDGLSGILNDKMYDIQSWLVHLLAGRNPKSTDHFDVHAADVTGFRVTAYNLLVKIMPLYESLVESWSPETGVELLKVFRCVYHGLGQAADLPNVPAKIHDHLGAINDKLNVHETAAVEQADIDSDEDMPDAEQGIRQLTLEEEDGWLRRK